MIRFENENSYDMIPMDASDLIWIILKEAGLFILYLHGALAKNFPIPTLFGGGRKIPQIGNYLGQMPKFFTISCALGLEMLTASSQNG